MLAKREHQKNLPILLERTLKKAKLSLKQIDLIAVTSGPGLEPALWTGIVFAKELSKKWSIPIVPINHMEGHIFSNLIEDPKPAFPFMNLTASGGHTQLVLVKEPFDYVILGETIDDAAGEAFDKVAKMLDIGYPGGPLIDKYAAVGNPRAVDFPRSYLDEGSFDFSFSGLKTSVLYYLKRSGFQKRTAEFDGNFIADVCASFQASVVEVLVRKLILAA